jgi:hypothetical protein
MGLSFVHSVLASVVYDVRAHMCLHVVCDVCAHMCLHVMCDLCAHMCLYVVCARICVSVCGVWCH